MGFADMYDSRIVSESASDADFERRLHLIHDMLTTLSGLASTPRRRAALQDVWPGALPRVQTRYARADGITRRRADALVAEAGLEGAAGLHLVTKRGGIPRAGDVAAVAFLHRRLDRALNRIDRLLPATA